MSIPVLHIVGRSNSGKTTLLEKLIAALSGQGLRVGTIKHSHHQPDMDTPGKDSWRHKSAGALTSMLVGSEQMMLVADVETSCEPESLARRYFEDMDLVLVEGYAAVPGAKIEVVRLECSIELCCSDDDIMAVVTDVKGLTVGVPIFGLDDVDGVVNFVLDWMGNHDGS